MLHIPKITKKNITLTLQSNNYHFPSYPQGPDTKRPICKSIKNFGQRSVWSEKKFTQDNQKIVNSEKIVYNKKTTRFFTHQEGSYEIVTGYIYSTVKDLLEGKQPKKKYCYIKKGVTAFSFDDPDTLPLQQKALKEIGLTSRSVLKYKSYCNYN